MTNYQFSKQLWARRLLNATDTRLVRELGSEDRPHQFTFSATYELPFGRGRALGGNANRVVSRFIGGWQINTIFFKQIGSPLQWGPLVFTGSSWSDIMNVAGKGTHSPANGAVTWFNTGVFDLVASRQPNAPNNQTQTQYRYFPYEVPGARAPGAQNFDLSFGKRTNITERFGLQFRAEFFNVANHPVVQQRPVRQNHITGQHPAGHPARTSVDLLDPIASFGADAFRVRSIFVCKVLDRAP
jgi:hypothetical protein